jgi:serine/threonine protein kinase
MIGLATDSSSYSSFASNMSTLQYRPKSAHTDGAMQMQTDDCDGETLAARYQMLEELGSGSFGTVYKAIEKSTGEIVAVKHVSNTSRAPLR